MLYVKPINLLELIYIVNNLKNRDWINSDRLYLNAINKKSYKNSFSDNGCEINTMKKEKTLYSDNDDSLKNLIIKYNNEKTAINKYKYINEILKKINNIINKYNLINYELIEKINKYSKNEHHKELLYNIFYDINNYKSDVCIYKYGQPLLNIDIYTKAIFYRVNNSILVFIPEKISRKTISFKMELFYLEHQVPIHVNMVEQIDNIFKYEISDGIKQEFKEIYKINKDYSIRTIHPIFNKFSDLRRYRFIKIQKLKKKG